MGGDRHRPGVRGADGARDRRWPLRRRPAHRQHVVEHDRVGLATVALADLVESATRCDDDGLAEHALGRLSDRAGRRALRGHAGCSLAPERSLRPATKPTICFRSALDELSRSTLATEGTDAAPLRRVAAAGPAPSRRAAHCTRRSRSSRRSVRRRSPRVLRAELAATGEHVRSGRHLSTSSPRKKPRSRGSRRRVSGTTRSPPSSTSRPAPSSTTCGRSS